MYYTVCCTRTYVYCTTAVARLSCLIKQFIILQMVDSCLVAMLVLSTFIYSNVTNYLLLIVMETLAILRRDLTGLLLRRTHSLSLH